LQPGKPGPVLGEMAILPPRFNTRWQQRQSHTTIAFLPLDHAVQL
jgi:hypothetical protein